MNSVLLIAVINLIALVVVSEGGFIHLAIEKCCYSGDNHAASHPSCDPPSNFPEVSDEDQSLCLASFNICCLRSQRNSVCQTGKSTAKVDGDCAVLPTIGGEAHKDCCEGCKLGINVGKLGEDCFFRGFSFSAPWDEAFYSCCSDAKKQITGDFVKYPVGPSQNRCVSDNPCSHLCSDYGGSVVVCSCEPGYKLNSNGFKCEDVDECAEKLDACNPGTESCLNTRGGYLCVENEGELRRLDNKVDYFDNRPLVPDNGINLNQNGGRCPPGSFYNASNRNCQDIDECAERTHTCVPRLESCRNTVGSFVCVPRDQPGNEGDKPGLKQCPPGYKYHPQRNCDDVDECQEGTHNCNAGSEICINSYGGYHCQLREVTACPAGYKRNHNGQTCEDVDECAENAFTCAEGQEECENTIGGYTCKPVCGEGFVFDTLQKRCVDFDECADKDDACPTTDSCINTMGSFKCVKDNVVPPPVNCPVGFLADQTGNCRDVDECQEGLHSCKQDSGEVCVNKVGSFDCLRTRKGGGGGSGSQICPNGMKLDPNSRKCVDIDECTENRHNCNPMVEECQNTMAGFRCVAKGADNQQSPLNAPCPRGYRRDSYSRRCVDLNECQLGVHNCENSQRCDNTVGSFVCVRRTDCGTGYTLNHQTGLCEDDDECAINPNQCGGDFACRNTEGSFRCDRVTCPEGERLLADGICHPINCAPGMQLDASGRCSDVNECITNPCRTNQRCVNTPGSFRCQSAISCGGGYEPNTYGTDCVDINECERATHQCGPNQICKNRPGGYTCECPVGYTLNINRNCEDIDECTRHRGVCSINSECQNTAGSYICHCKAGFRKTANSQTCEDIDECQETQNLCQHNCINTWGSFQCTCKPGFLVGADNRSCQDVDECQLYADKGSLCFGFCVNKPGSYACQCPEGYRLGGDTRTCQDINECVEQGVCSGEHQTCLNTRGGYKCYNLTCPPNYVKDHAHKNRCKRTDLLCRRGDESCLKEPTSLSSNYLTMVSKLRIPASGQLDLFTMRGPRFDFTDVLFELDFKSARAPSNILAATKADFHLRRTQGNEAMISLTRSLEGPQEIELELNMKIYNQGLYAGRALAKIFIIVTRYEF